MKPGKVLFGVVIALFLFGCKSPVSETNALGSLRIRSYSESYTDESEISEDNPIYAILDVGFPDGSSKTIVTDALGYYDFGRVTAGTYKITPRYISNASTEIITVGKSESVSKTILIPNIEISYYIINAAKTPVDNAVTREALMKSINRQEIVGTIDTGYEALTNFIPSKMSGSWSANASVAVESLSDSQSIVGNTSLSVTLSYNDNIKINGAVAKAVQSQWQKIGSNTTVTLDGSDWESFLTKRNAENYQLARDGWGFDSNNPLSLYKALGFIDGTEYTDLIKDADAYLAKRQMSEFESTIVQLNNYIMNNYLVIPLYQKK